MNESSSSWQREVGEGKRFQFGANWGRFLEKLTDGRIVAAEASLCDMLRMNSLKGKRFIDVGSGSGLFSLAARRRGAHVHSFDFDPQSVGCTAELKRRYFGNDPDWRIEQGSVLDSDYMASLGQFDIVYSWGVLHHTGAMWQAFDNVEKLVGPGGKLFIAIYNDQGRRSRAWIWLKKRYVSGAAPVKGLLTLISFVILWGPPILLDSLRGRPLRKWRAYGKSGAGRGMDPWRDLLDWIGGYPFEVATPDQIFEYFHARGFELSRLNTVAGKLGCNQFVFTRSANAAASLDPPAS